MGRETASPEDAGDTSFIRSLRLQTSGIRGLRPKAANRVDGVKLQLPAALPPLPSSRAQSCHHGPSKLPGLPVNADVITSGLALLLHAPSWPAWCAARSSGAATTHRTGTVHAMPNTHGIGVPISVHGLVRGLAMQGIL